MAKHRDIRDMSMEKDIGYLIRASEDNSKDISKFYELLASHMAAEDKERRALNTKLTFLFVGVLVLMIKDSSLGGTMLSTLQAALPFFL